MPALALIEPETAPETTLNCIAIQGRCFMVGCPRSGTTLLQSFLAAHSQVMSFPETTWYRSAVGMAKHRVEGAHPRGISDHVRKHVGEARWRMGIAAGRGERRFLQLLKDINREDCADMFPKGSTSLKAQSDAFVALLDRLTLEQNGSVWIEKSPFHGAYADVIEKYVPDARFIHILRNGADVVASIYDAAQTYPDTHWNHSWGTVEKCVSQWNHVLAITRSLAHKPNHKVVRYETLIADTKNTVTDLCSFLDLPFEDKMLENYKTCAQSMFLAQTHWKAVIFGEIKDRNSTKFQKLFNEDQQRYILANLTPLQPGEFE